MARPRAGGRRHPARMGALDVRLPRAAATTNGARAGPAAHRRARLRLRIFPRRARSSRADRASDARMSATRNRGPMRLSRLGRGAALARLALRIGGRYLAGSPRLIFASVERRGALRHELALRTADDVVEELGSMKGALMKLGQMASYIDEDMPETFRKAMGRLQHNAPPMSPELASSVIVEELGDAAERGGLHRTGAPGDHVGWEGGRGQGSISRHRPHHHLGREERRTSEAGRRRGL